jgi:cell surface protein SprA
MTKQIFFAIVSACSVATLLAFTGPNGSPRPVPDANDWSTQPKVTTAQALPVRRPKARAVTTDTLPPIKDRKDDFLLGKPKNPIDLKDPKAIEQKVEYDPVTNRYIVSEKIGDDYYRSPTYMTFDEYVKWRAKKQQQEYFDRLAGVSSGNKKKSGLSGDPIGKFAVKKELVERLFGSNVIDIRPQGNLNLTLGGRFQRLQNPILTQQQQRQGGVQPVFDMDINIGAKGKVGEKLNLDFSYNTQAVLAFDNIIKLNYDTKNFSEDEIIQKIEAGNVSLPLRSNLIKGAQNLFGIKTELKFGHLRTTLIASQQNSRQNNIQVQGGAQIQNFQVYADDYDENRHFFVSQWNRDQFEPSLKCLPVPLSLFNITRIEVWLTNDKLVTENVRDVITFMDLGESKPYNPRFRGPVIHRDIKGEGLPDNGNNAIYQNVLDELRRDSTFRFSDQVVRRLNRSPFNMTQIVDYEKQRARLLTPQEYNFNEQLGFISINLNVQPDQVVGVAMEYTYNGVPHKIGEFTSDVPNGDSLNQNVLFLKMLKSTTANVNYPIWDLMMKNVYSLGALNIDPQNFRFDVFYEDPGKGQKRFLDGEGIPTVMRSKPLLQIFNLDNLNLQNDPGADGIFDFVPGITMNLRTGRMMFPVLEPFGSFLRQKFNEADPGLDSAGLQRKYGKYLYTPLYDSTLFRAREFQELNRITLRGTYKSSSTSEISLGTFNLPRGSVRVSGGGRQLVEGVDYEVDYNIGRVRILNDAVMQSGQAVNVSFEDNAFFGFNSRAMLGARFDYAKGKDWSVGGTVMKLFERPLVQKVNFGDDPINNTVYGIDAQISKDAPWLTKALDRLPLISTKAPSSIFLQGEAAMLKPGHNRAINQQGLDRGGSVYIDDFEGSTANFPISFPTNAWVAASVPQGDVELFPESVLDSSLVLGANRAGLSWYIADPFGARDTKDANNPYGRLFNLQDVFPNRQLNPTEQSLLRPFDITIYPRERGPYNFDIPGGHTGYSRGLAFDGRLNAPETRWAGIMRGLNNNDFEAANIEFLEFWMLNPYMEKTDGEGISKDGDMYIDLGTISEDIMRDGRQFFENALPTGPGTGATANTVWGRVPVLPPVVNAFDNLPERRTQQDLGLDGLNDEGEQNFYKPWLDIIRSANILGRIKDSITRDPANDNFTFFNDPKFGGLDSRDGPGVLTRYRKFNGQQGNSPVNNFDALNPAATNLPDMEDLNRDNTLNETEAYFRYKISLKKTRVGSQESLDLTDPQLRTLITDTVVVIRDGVPHLWYRFKLPLDYKDREKIGGIQDFRSIRFMRMLWKGFSERTTFRFATLELGRNQWRRYALKVNTPGCNLDTDKPRSGIDFDVNAVSIERNAGRTPFNYTIPLGINRQQSVGAFPNILQNEQALAMSVCKLPYCEARAVFKPLNMDLRQFARMKMFVHGESRNAPNFNDVPNDALRVFIRVGSDFVSNFYEYEIPLKPSDPLAPAIIGAQGNRANSESQAYKIEVWRDENTIDFPLELFTQLKVKRNDDPNADPSQFYEMTDPDTTSKRGRGILRVLGNPNLGFVKGVMVGVVNKDPLHDPDRGGSGRTHCAEVWINELRLTGFNEATAFAAQGRADIKLADLGNVSIAGQYTGIGWGSLEQRVAQRQREAVSQIDMSTNIELSKLIPGDHGIRLPFYAQYSNITRTPEFDPYDLDIKLKDKLRRTTDGNTRDSIRSTSQDVTITRGYNFTNVRKEYKGNGRKIPLPWNIENFSLTYAYNQQARRTPFIITDQQDQYRGALDWQYTTGLKPMQPFKNLFGEGKLIKSDKYLKFISDFNFNPLPNTYSFNSNAERIQQKTVWRFAGEDPQLNTYFNRRFTWDRNYDLGWDISKGIRVNFNAVARSLLDEPLEYRPDGVRVTPTERRDSILTNARQLGRPKNYNHTASLNYTLPTRTIPFMDWVTARASYTAGYSWSAQSLKLQTLDAGSFGNRENAVNLGHVIQNNSVRQINGDFNFEGLYNKSKYLQKINRPLSQQTKSRKKPAADEPADGQQPADGTADKTKDKKDKKDKKEKKEKEREPSMAERIALRPLMLVRKARVAYTENYTTVIPGFIPETRMMGLSEGFAAPGWAFVAGVQPSSDWLDEASRKGWITERPELNQQVMRNFSQNFDAAATIEPFTDFRIELTANRQYTRNSTELYKDQVFNLNPDSIGFQHRAQRDMGSFTVSYLPIRTLFNNDIDGLFARYVTYRQTISERLGVIAGNLNPHEVDGSKFKAGYGKIQQEVLTPAFIAAYTGKDPKTQSLNLFNTMPAVNWRLNYNGLSKVGNLKKIFASVSIQHGYRSTMQVNSYNTDIFFNPDQPYTIDPLNSNYVARFEIPQIVINEQFTPLIAIDMRMQNDMTLRLDFKKSRNLAMSFIDYQLAETRSTGYAIDMGYRIKNVNIPFLTGKKTKKTSTAAAKKKKKNPLIQIGDQGQPPVPAGAGPVSNDINIKFNFEYRDDITANHRLDQLDAAIPTRGARTIKISPSADYVINRRMKLRAFCDYNRTVPKTSQSFPITQVNAGFTLQFSLN